MSQFVNQAIETKIRSLEIRFWDEEVIPNNE